ncbi:hypothetical protein [Streptomyces sp. NPDC098101]
MAENATFGVCDGIVFNLRIFGSPSDGFSAGRLRESPEKGE